MILILNFSAFSFLNAQQKEPTALPEKDVPKRVLNKFKEKHVNAKDVRWYPYPNQYVDRSAEPVHFPIGWRGNAPNYYEVRYSDDVGKIRKIYEGDGSVLITSRPLSAADIPNQIKNQLNDKGYNGWQVLSVERISRRGEAGKFLKIWLRNDGKKRILYFNESHKLVKTLRFDNDVIFSVNEKARFKVAPRSTRQRAIAGLDVPETIKSKVKAQYKDMEVVEWYINERIYDPFESGTPGLVYYDIKTPVYYQLLFKVKKKQCITTYNSEGGLLESAEIIPMKKLPTLVLITMKNDFPSWKLSNRHDKVEMEDGNYLYKVYGTFNDLMNVVILNEKGQKVDLSR